MFEFWCLLSQRLLPPSSPTLLIVLNSGSAAFSLPPTTSHPLNVPPTLLIVLSVSGTAFSLPRTTSPLLSIPPTLLIIFTGRGDAFPLSPTTSPPPNGPSYSSHCSPRRQQPFLIALNRRR
ncbi:hypothetical protein A0H81_03872 [Grifola frondosa]|uniref:Uncharacterized protein n=1 Tax=Grifola frondosa TaxID=5627 RepID=A0A1C7MI51_GRIFR|nr:hypothetical protein A0H81_03872 [Grifola frondosa]